jgi:hypothetical protein
LLVNLRQVFEHCRQYRIAFNPKKSKIGLDRIDWVGHQLDAEGIHFSAEPLSEVAEFPTHVGANGLRSFLGLANYFRDHVRHYADMQRPMRDVLTKKHDKSKKFRWSELAMRGFRENQIILRTDASDLCQVVGEREYISCAFN